MPRVLSWRRKSDTYPLSDISNLLPILYPLLDTPFMVQSISAIVEVLTNSVFRDGKATTALTEPLLRWMAVRGMQIVNQAISGMSSDSRLWACKLSLAAHAPIEQDADSEDLNAISKLVEALVEHSANWMASKLDQPDIQSFLTLLLSLSGFPGLPGRDENVSEVRALRLQLPKAF
jgi:hypothetical protein